MEFPNTVELASLGRRGHGGGRRRRHGGGGGYWNYGPYYPGPYYPDMVVVPPIILEEAPDRAILRAKCEMGSQDARCAQFEPTPGGGLFGMGAFEDTLAQILEELRRIGERFPTPPVVPGTPTPATQAMAGFIDGLGSTTWSSWYYNTYLPQYYAQQYQQRCPSGYTLQQQASGVQACVPAYQQAQQYAYPMSSYYTPGYGYGYTNPNYPVTGNASGYGMTAQQCVGQGMMWDSFSGQCQSYQATTQQAAQQTTMPNVLGAAKWTAVQMLNNAGYTVWLLSENGVPQGSPSGFDARRVQIIVNNGVVTVAQVG